MLVQAAKSLLKGSVDYGAHWWGPHRRQPQQPQLWVLMYHRILPRSDPRYALEEPGMVVEPETFAMHMDLVREHFTIMSLQEWLQRRDSGQTLPLKSCAITFDDGWLDNFEYAFPILEKKQVPATVFVVTHMIGSNESFWPNRVARLLATRPEALQSLPLVDDRQLASQPPGRELLSRVIRELKAHPDQVISHWLNELDPSPAMERSLMNWDELRQMVASGLIDVGSHGCRHYRLLESLDPETIASEISESKQRLADELPRFVHVFCFPNGDSSALARDLVEEHYMAAVTTRRGINSSRELKPFELLRIAIHEDRCNTAVKLSSRLANWY